MNVLIIGSGGREHALAMAYSRSSRVDRVFVAPGNGLMDYRDPKISLSPEVSITDFTAILELVKKRKIDLVDVAPDDALASGYVDKLTAEKIPAFGPTRKASEIEWNKDWSRGFMQKYHLPIPHFSTFSSHKKAIDFINNHTSQVWYIKASGLALGKGVIRAEGREEARDAIRSMKSFGSAGNTFLIEEALTGEEFSLFVLCDGEHVMTLKAAQDHKTVYNADTGPNTGGMGSVAPTTAITPEIIRNIEAKILRPFIGGMKNEGRPYSGILYLGGMVTKDGVKIIEFNARWGDPEAEVILPGIRSDYLSVIEAIQDHKLLTQKIRLDAKIRVSIAGCSLRYPGDYAKVIGKEIFGIPEILRLKHVTLFGAGIKRSGDRFFVNGGRIFHVVGEGNTFSEARKRAYDAMSRLYIEGNNFHYRTDIGWREIERYKNF
jgi:phosphoribosylamine---glycine ligase